MKDAKDVLDEHGKRRREFVAKAGKVAVATPAIALLLSRTAVANLPVSGVVFKTAP